MEDLTKKIKDFIGEKEKDAVEVEQSKTVNQKDGLIERVEVKNLNINVKTDKGIKQLLND